MKNSFFLLYLPKNIDTWSISNNSLKEETSMNVSKKIYLILFILFGVYSACSLFESEEPEFETEIQNNAEEDPGAEESAQENQENESENLSADSNENQAEVSDPSMLANPSQEEDFSAETTDMAINSNDITNNTDSMLLPNPENNTQQQENTLEKNQEFVNSSPSSEETPDPLGEPQILSNANSIDPFKQAASPTTETFAPTIENNEIQKSENNSTLSQDQKYSAQEQKAAPFTEGNTFRYFIHKGDTLAKISKKIYGTIHRWKEIANQHNITDPRKLQIGKELTFVKTEQTRHFFHEINQSEVQITVKRGDTLSSLAQLYLQSIENWPVIYKMNQSKIQNPDKIFVSQVFIIKRTPIQSLAH